MTLVRLTNRTQKNLNPIGDFFNEFPFLFKDDNRSNFYTQIPVNIKENEQGYLVEVIAPGRTKSDFNLTIEKGILTISAETKNEEAGNESKIILNEFNPRSFKRSFTLGEEIDSEKIEAKYVNGVLTLNLPRKEEVKASAKQISIQ